jgi:hypothetical protein
MELFGDKRNDPYYWLRDDDRKNPDIIAHLNQENAYAELVMSGKKHILVVFFLLLLCINGTAQSFVALTLVCKDVSFQTLIPAMIA